MKANKIKNIIDKILESGLWALPRTALANTVTSAIRDGLTGVLGHKLGEFSKPTDYSSNDTSLEFAYDFTMFDAKQGFRNGLHIIIDFNRNENKYNVILKYRLYDFNFNTLFHTEVKKSFKETEDFAQLKPFYNNVMITTQELFKGSYVLKSIDQYFYGK
jgi:hypothetical protein